MVRFPAPAAIAPLCPLLASASMATSARMQGTACGSDDEYDSCPPHPPVQISLGIIDGAPDRVAFQLRNAGPRELSPHQLKIHDYGGTLSRLADVIGIPVGADV